MKLRWLGLLLVCGLAGSAARAQVGVYGKLDYVRYSEFGSTSTNYTGGGVGVYDDFLHLGPVNLGLDLRGDYARESKSNYRSLLGGVRVAVKVPVVGLRPYVQASAGVGGSRAKGPFAVGITDVSFNNKLTYEGFVGLDARVLPFIDWRVIEVGGGSGSKLGSTSPTIFNVSSGLVLRF